MQMTKKVVSVVLAVMMVVSMMVVMGAASASAAEVSADSENANIMYVNAAGTTTKYYDQFPTLQSGTYTVLKNFTQTVRAATGTFGATYTIDLNKKTVTFDIPNDGFAFGINHRGGTATIKNGTMNFLDNADDDKAISVNGGTVNIESSVTINGSGDVSPVTVYKGTLNTAGKLNATDSFAIATNGSSSSNFTINVTGGTVKSTNAAAIYQPANGTLNISGGTITGKTGVYVKSGTTNITGGTITGNGADADYDYNSSGCNSTGDALVVDSCGYPGGAPTVNVNGGTFKSTNADAIASYAKSDDAEFATDTTPAVTGFVKQATISSGTVDADLYDDDLYDIDTNTNTATPKTLTDEIAWEWVESDNVSYQYKAKMTVTVGGEEYYTTTVSPTIKAVNGEIVYTATAKYAGVTYTAPEKNTGSVIMTSGELSKAIAAGGEWSIGKDITNVGSASVPDGFKLNGNGYTLYANTSVLPQNYLFTCKDANAKFELNNVTLDGGNRRYGAISAYTGNSGNNPGNVITLNNVTIQNFKSSNYVGAVYAFGSSTIELNDCTVTGNKNNTNAQKVNGEQVSAEACAANSGKDIWAGAKANVIINGGTVGEVLLHGGTANVTVDDDANVDTVRFGFTNSQEDSSKMKAVVNDGTVGEVVSYTDFVEENVVKDPTNATVGAPEGYTWEDSATDGKKTLVPENPLNQAMDKEADGNQFGISCNYKKAAILGVQKKSKAEVNAPNTSESHQEDGNDIRFVAVIDTDVLQDAIDYGFVITKVDADQARTYANTKFDRLTITAGGAKVVSAKDTWNNVCGNAAYGDPSNSLGYTDYKYVTCAVNRVADDEYIVVRFYVTDSNNVTRYAKYAGHNYHFTGCMSGKDAAAIA